jgi:MFS family permease
MTVVNAVQVITSAVEGVALSTIVMHATTHLGLATAAVGTVLTVAGTAALGSAVPLGAFADRIGLRTAATIYGLGAAAALAGYALADSLLGYAVAATCFATSQAASRSIRQALAVSDAAPAARLKIRARMHTLLNVGFGLGTMIGGLIAVVGTDRGFRIGYGVAACVAAVTAIATVAVPRTATARHGSGSRGVLTALRDRRFAKATFLAAVIQLTMPVLTVLLPVWVLSYTSGQRWVPGAALTLNTVIVVGAQTPWATRVVTTVSAARSAHLAAGTLLVSCVLMGVAAVNLGPTYAAVVVVVAVVFLTIGEVTGGAATWFVALQDVPLAMEGQYQSAFSMSSSGARIIGSAVALPLMTGAVVGGWIILGAAMAAAALAVSALATRRGEVTTGDL